jgi:hypothetical protein
LRAGDFAATSAKKRQQSSGAKLRPFLLELEKLKTEYFLELEQLKY